AAALERGRASGQHSAVWRSPYPLPSERRIVRRGRPCERSLLARSPGRHLRRTRRVIAVDTNILVYAHRRDSQWFGAASRRIRELAESNETWGIPWPCIHEFLAIVTNSRIY